ncbi:MAG TPA: phage tail sheath C-terminal domain-containing protein [Pyrinomonadaceae bacterium]|nr:phage tail sheath C-terminal domain-containing protein [Pyrinomonadaceae bacterium]
MPVAVSYPGVYVEEIPSGVRTITGVSTSVAAFVGWAAKGPTDRAELVLSWADFERKFGGLDNRSYLGYSVYQFFNNGGSRAYIVRLVTTGSTTPTENAAAATVTLDGKLDVTASNEGDWGESYAVITKQRTDADGKDANQKNKFRLVVVQVNADGMGVPVEVFENLSMDPNDARYVETVLKNDSNLVRATPKSGAPDPPADPAGVRDDPDPSDSADKLPFDISKDAIPDNAKLTKGAEGKVLVPNDGKFEKALLPTSGTGGAFHLDRIDLFNLLCVPGETDAAAIQELQNFCRDRRAFLIADSARDDDFGDMQSGPGNITGDDSINSAFYFPWILAPDKLAENRPKEFPPCGFVAGIYARTDASRGVWKAPAGTEASLTGAIGVSVNKNLTDSENGVLNPLAVNCIRTLPVYGTIVWGARTLQGNDERGSEWKYIPVRRTALYIEESLFRALKWVVFEPNDEPLWSQIRLNVGAFMHNLFRQGAFQGTTPKDAYFVKCDKETTTQNDVNLGIVNIIVGFAPLKPAEFVIIKLQQMAGQIEV